MTQRQIQRKHKDKYRLLSLNISFYRKKKGWTQEDLAGALYLSRSHISNIEAPGMETSLSLNTLFDIADALEVPVSALFEMR